MPKVEPIWCFSSQLGAIGDQSPRTKNDDSKKQGETQKKSMGNSAAVVKLKPNRARANSKRKQCEKCKCIFKQ